MDILVRIFLYLKSNNVTPRCSVFNFMDDDKKATITARFCYTIGNILQITLIMSSKLQLCKGCKLKRNMKFPTPYVNDIIRPDNLQNNKYNFE